jgi:hypothetical protein
MQILQVLRKMVPWVRIEDLSAHSREDCTMWNFEDDSVLRAYERCQAVN